MCAAQRSPASPAAAFLLHDGKHSSHYNYYKDSMPKKIIKRYMPEPHKIREHRSLSFLGDILHDPGLWHMNRRSVSGAFAVGLFFAWVPVPFQMALAALVAVPFRVNLPISVALVWITNPLTMPPMFYAAYLLGTVLLGTEPMAFEFELSWEWLKHGLGHIWEPFLLGCGVLGVISAALGYAGMRGIWRYHLIRRLQEKRARYKAAREARRHHD